MGSVPRLEMAQNDEFEKSVIFFLTFLEAQNRLNEGPRD